MAEHTRRNRYAVAVARFRAALASAAVWPDPESDPWLDPAVIEAAKRLNAARQAAQHKGE